MDTLTRKTEIALVIADLNEDRMANLRVQIADYQERVRIAWARQKAAAPNSEERSAARKECIFCAGCIARLQDLLGDANGAG